MMNLPPNKPLANLGPFVASLVAGKSSWLVLGNWQQVHENISRAFTENTPTSNGTNWFFFGVMIIGLLLLAAGAYHSIWQRRETASSDTRALYKKPRPSELRDDSDGQNRKWVRVPAGFDIWYAPIVSSETRETGSLQKARLVDISGGGCLLATDSKLNKGDQIKAVLNLPHGPDLLLNGRVVRVVDRLSSPSACLVGIEFVNLSNGDRDRINKWIFSRQQQLIQKQRWVAEGLCVLCGNPLPKSNPKNFPYCTRCLTCEQPVSDQELEEE